VSAFGFYPVLEIVYRSGKLPEQTRHIWQSAYKTATPDRNSQNKEFGTIYTSGKFGNVAYWDG